MMMLLLVIEDEYTVWYDGGTNMMMVLIVIENEYTVWCNDGTNGN